MNLILDSVYFTIFGIDIYLYGVMIALGILAGVGLAVIVFKSRNLASDHILNIALICIPSAILGARIYYCLFYDKDYTLASFFDIGSGGLAVYGAIIGGAIGVLVYCLVRKINFFHIADALVPSLAIGQCLGRIGCYFGGCCYGEETTLQMFPFSVEINGVWHLATFFYESFATLLICIALIVMLRFFRLHGFVFCGYFFLYGVARFFIEGVRGDSLYFLGLRVSQVLSLILIVASISLALFFVFYYKKHGVLTSIFDQNYEIKKPLCDCKNEQIATAVEDNKECNENKQEVVIDELEKQDLKEENESIIEEKNDNNVVDDGNKNK